MNEVTIGYQIKPNHTNKGFARVEIRQMVKKNVTNYTNAAVLEKERRKF